MSDETLTMVTLKADGGHAMRLIDPEDCLADVQAAVGGHLEVVPYLKLFAWEGTTYPCKAFCDEEGKLKGKPLNEAATYLWHAQLPNTLDVLVGDIAFVFGDPALMRLL